MKCNVSVIKMAFDLSNFDKIAQTIKSQIKFKIYILIFHIFLIRYYFYQLKSKSLLDPIFIPII